MHDHVPREQAPGSTPARTATQASGETARSPALGSIRGKMGAQIPVSGSARGGLPGNPPLDNHALPPGGVASRVTHTSGPRIQAKEAGAPNTSATNTSATNTSATNAALNNQFKGSEPCGIPVPGTIASSLAGRGGQPLAAGVRSDAEQQFGHSFAGVRVHTGTDAHRMARAVNARAFTLGEDVAFRAGQYAPGTPAGRDLLWHELGHVAAPPAGDAQLLRSPLYDRSNYQLSPLSTGHTPASLHAQVTAKIPAELTSANVAGMTPGTDAETFLWYVLFVLGQKDRWDTFIRLETAIGWPDATTGVAPMGLVTVTIDDKGNATAELMQATALKRPAVITAADATKKLTGDYGIRSIGGDKPWLDAELSDVAASVGRLPATDRAALKGVDLLRVATLRKGYAGEFSSGGGIANGATTVTERPSLKLADKAFDSSSLVFGDVANQAPASFETILHEVGHAVEKQPKRVASESYETVIIKQNKAVKQQNDSQKKFYDAKTSAADKAKATTDYNAAKVDYAAAIASKPAKKNAYAATMVPSSVTKPLADAATVKKTANAAALKTALAAVKGFGAQEQTDSADYRKEIDALKAVLDAFVAKINPDSSISEDDDDVVLAAVAKRNAARDALSKASPGNTALATFAPVEKAQDELFDAERMLGHTYRQSLRLHNFVKLVNANKITPFTKYARDNWPYEPAEFYAEAYSLWLNDPAFVKANYQPVFDFFQNGDYRK